MSSATLFIRRILHEFRLRRRFPCSVIHPGATADSESFLGDWSVLFANARLVNSSIGRFSYIQEGSALYSTDVGPFCSIAANATIGLVDHPTTMVSTSPVFYDNTQPLPRFLVDENRFPQKPLRTVLEADVWIGEGVRIRAGVRIGVGAVIGAGAVVTGDIQPYTIAAGVPCRDLKQRFPEDIVRRLIESKWWEMDEQSLGELAKYFVEPNLLLSALDKATKRLSTSRRID